MTTAPATKLKTLIEVLKYHLEDDSLPALKVNQANYELIRGEIPEEPNRSRTRKILVFIAWPMMVPAFRTVKYLYYIILYYH